MVGDKFANVVQRIEITAFITDELKKRNSVLNVIVDSLRNKS